MPRLAWFLLQDGRSLIASCENSMADKVREVVERRRERTLVLTGEDVVETLSADRIKAFAIVDDAPTVFKQASIYNFVAI